MSRRRRGDELELNVSERGALVSLSQWTVRPAGPGCSRGSCEAPPEPRVPYLSPFVVPRDYSTELATNAKCVAAARITNTWKIS